MGPRPSPRPAPGRGRTAWSSIGAPSISICLDSVDSRRRSSLRTGMARPVASSQWASITLLPRTRSRSAMPICPPPTPLRLGASPCTLDPDSLRSCE
eukprot:4595822-Pyramimonas_sp.AAC.1